jgi:hypothetical protein
MYQQQGTNILLGNATGDYIQIIPMNKFTNWSRIFGTDADDEQGKKCIIKSTNLQWNITTNEPDPVGYSMFLVSVKKIGSDLLSGGDMTGVTAGQHYVGGGSKVLLNMNYFNIHYVKRFVTGSESIARNAIGAIPGVQNVPSETQSINKSGKFTVPYGKYGMTVQNPTGDWKASGYPKADTCQYFWLTFCDNATIDLQNPYISYNAIHNVVVSA